MKQVRNTNPIWTAIVRTAIEDWSIDFSISSAVDTAFVENQTESDNNVATVTSKSAICFDRGFIMLIKFYVRESK